MYSLVSASVLGFDLTRLAGGGAVAEVLLRALTLRHEDLPTLAAALPDADRRTELWVAVQQAASRVPSIRELGEEITVQTLDAVRTAPIGTVDGLLSCLRHDVLGWTWTGTGAAARQSPDAERATAVLCDAAVAAYLRDQLDEETRRRLGAGWVLGTRRLPAPGQINLGPHHASVQGLLTEVRTLTPVVARRLVRAAEEQRRAQPPTGWATAVHSAAWAAYLSDRVRTAAAAQLLLVTALDNPVVPRADRAGGVWNLVSGAVQALVVRDLLDTQAAYRLVAPVLTVLGPAWLDPGK
ncbi:hypothetical protein GCM10010124_08120 [Pilimelia terevasa]|uniref:Uncharacterized protein n=1 Tax=Pilimelia terevasa TaxID=53372 RepID=A0A8J3BKS1_9ACTN|nr:hypothetical protein [Pilimelia terevasa]GGK17950.1 hypothetical protein GCM10010124_08120 [Pilimelia terevasa]